MAVADGQHSPGGGAEPTRAPEAPAELSPELATITTHLHYFDLQDERAREYETLRARLTLLEHHHEALASAARPLVGTRQVIEAALATVYSAEHALAALAAVDRMLERGTDPLAVAAYVRDTPALFGTPQTPVSDAQMRVLRTYLPVASGAAARLADAVRDARAALAVDPNVPARDVPAEVSRLRETTTSLLARAHQRSLQMDGWVGALRRQIDALTPEDRALVAAAAPGYAARLGRDRRDPRGRGR